MRARHRERRLHRIDAADEIEMLGRRFERCDVVAAECQENTLRHGTERANCIQRISGFDPAVPGNGNPAGTAQRQQRNPGLSGGGCGVGGHNGRVGVRGIDQDIDVVIDEVTGETFGPPKPTRPHRNRLPQRRDRTAGERQRDGKVRPAGQAAGQFARLRGAAENENGNRSKRHGDFLGSWPGLSRPSRQSAHRDLLHEIAGTGPAMTKEPPRLLLLLPGMWSNAF